jgi:DNA-binding response OmpR family regulator
VNGERMVAMPAVHRLVGVLMRARGRVVSDERLAGMMEIEDGDARAHVAVIASHARRAFDAIGVECPFVRRRGEGFTWIGDEQRIAAIANPSSICTSCGYNLVAESFIESGPFSHDPRTGVACVAGVPLKGRPQLHSMMGTFMRSGGSIIPYHVIVDRMGSDTDDPGRLVRALVSLLRKAMRHHGTDLPILTIHAVGYQWIEDASEHRSTYHGPPAPRILRHGEITGPDLTSDLAEVRHGFHACGCPAQDPEMSAGEWSWSRTGGLRHSGSSFVLRNKASRMMAHVMAASGRYVHAARDLGHVIGGDPVDACNHLNVLVCKLRAKAAEHGVEVPISARNGHGIRWSGEPPALHHADLEQDCPPCLERAARIRNLIGEPARTTAHPPRLRGRPMLVADLLSAKRGDTVSAESLLELIGSEGGAKIIAVYIVAIRRSYREAGLPDPIRNRWGSGYEWIGA